MLSLYNIAKFDRKFKGKRRKRALGKRPYRNKQFLSGTGERSSIKPDPKKQNPTGGREEKG